MNAPVPFPTLARQTFGEDVEDKVRDILLNLDDLRGGMELKKVRGGVGREIRDREHHRARKEAGREDWGGVGRGRSRLLSALVLRRSSGSAASHALSPVKIVFE